jgi:hypothetical protein
MKKNFLATLLLGCAFLSFGQAKLEIGLKGGVNLATLNTDNLSVDESNVTAFHGGGYALIKITKFGIQPEALFSKRGTDKIDMAYLDVPVMLKFYLLGGLNLQAGPQFGVLLNAEDENGDSVKGILKGSDVSAALGAGWDLPFGLSVTGRYILGISDVNDSVGPSIKGSTYQFSVGYRLFKIGN